MFQCTKGLPKFNTITKNQNRFTKNPKFNSSGDRCHNQPYVEANVALSCSNETSDRLKTAMNICVQKHIKSAHILDNDDKTRRLRKAIYPRNNNSFIVWEQQLLCII